MLTFEGHGRARMQR